MRDNDSAKRTSSTNRRRFLTTVGASAALGLAGCIADSGGGGGSGGGNGSGGNASGLPPKQQGVETWGERINSYAGEANIDWEQFSGTSLRMGMNSHPFTDGTQPLLSYFTDLTGIEVTYDTYAESDLWNRLRTQLSNEQSTYDGFFMGLWPSAQYYAAGYTQNLSAYWNDPKITDKEWYHLEDFTESAIDAYTYQDELSALPFGVEPYGCLAYDKPTFEQLGISEPTNFEELESAAKQISESSEVERAGIGSRASSTPLSTANWASMFRSYGADWISYTDQEAQLSSQQGVAALEKFATLMGQYGPPDVGSFDWTRNIQTYGQGQLGMAYVTASVVGSIPQEQRSRTKWLPPLEGPDGDRVAANWQWGLGISQYSQNPEATWLLLQWLTCRPAQLVTSSPQWQDAPFYGWARNNWLFDRDEFQPGELGENWQTTFNEGMSMVPSKPPAVPLDVPQNMDIMSEAATAMNAAVTGTSAKQALDNAAQSITRIAKNIPDSYIEPYR
ncbi:hypothetical protein BRD01_02380 [Halobacteriales archaeon QS_8_65_32]|nr:MAG: hypothetical protein BRD01_02380 [Halobacteriales archaeon QS_8_65_32]